MKIHHNNSKTQEIPTTKLIILGIPTVLPVLNKETRKLNSSLSNQRFSDNQICKAFLYVPAVIVTIIFHPHFQHKMKSEILFLFHFFSLCFSSHSSSTASLEQGKDKYFSLIKDSKHKYANGFV